MQNEVIKKIYKYTTIIILLLPVNTFLYAQTVILYGNKASEIEHNAADDLKNDILKAYPEESVLISGENYKLKASDKNIIIIGTKQTSRKIAELYSKKQNLLFSTELEPETFILQSQSSGNNTIPKKFYIIGADNRGLYYGVYEFSAKILHIDPYEYWTGKKPQPRKKFVLPEMSFREKPPVFAKRGYFDNDDDMLANWKGRKLIVEFDIWKEMINSLMRLRYNYIDIHDLLGRAEFWQWDYYKKMTEYHTDLDLVNKVIDYAHSKGMMVQIPMYLGWEFHHMDLDKICLTKYYDHWMEVYKYYLTKTPLAKADIYLQRPRHPYYDMSYRCKEETDAGIKSGPLMTKMFKGLLNLIEKYNPHAVLVCDLWREGRTMWRNGDFVPDHKIQMLWADYYGGDFREWPDDLKRYKFGIYVHAGIWLNQVMQDPLVYQISAAVKEAVSRNMTNNMFVNGQDFKHFILNLELCARVAWDPLGFKPANFYKEWTSRYFGEKASPFVIKSLILLHQAHKATGGFRAIMGASVKILENLEKPEQKFKFHLKNIAETEGLSRLALELAEETLPLVPEKSRMVYDDQIVFPVTIYNMNIRFLKDVTLYAQYLKNGIHNTQAYSLYAQNMKNSLLILRKMLDKGSKWKKWDGWTKCENFRVFTPPPKIEYLDDIIEKYGK